MIGAGEDKNLRRLPVWRLTDIHEISIHSEVGSLDERLRNKRVGIHDVPPCPARMNLASTLSFRWRGCCFAYFLILDLALGGGVRVDGEVFANFVAGCVKVLAILVGEM